VFFYDRSDDRCGAVLRNASTLARSSGELGPLHLLVALSEDDGPALRLLTAPHVPGGLRAVVLGDLAPTGSTVGWDSDALQVWNTANQWALDDSTRVAPEHLLVALAEQANPDVADACATAGVALDRARTVAMTLLGWNDGRTLALVKSGFPAGTGDQPPLPINQLPANAWAELQARLPRLPFARIRHTWQLGTLRGIEGDAAWRSADRHHVSDDDRYSMMHHHARAVDDLAAEAIPDVVDLARSEDEDEYELMRTRPFGEYVTLRLGHRTHRMASPLPTGWLTWFGNRRAGIRDKWNRLRFRITCRY
jgi:Clp amino terminal domain, pathogenicity island component